MIVAYIIVMKTILNAKCCVLSFALLICLTLPVTSVALEEISEDEKYIIRKIPEVCSD